MIGGYNRVYRNLRSDKQVANTLLIILHFLGAGGWLTLRTCSFPWKQNDGLGNSKDIREWVKGDKKVLCVQVDHDQWKI